MSTPRPSSYQQPSPPRPQYNRSFQKTVVKARKSIEADRQVDRQLLHSHFQSISKLEATMGQLATFFSRRYEGKLPNQSLVNPKGQYGVECESAAVPSSYFEQSQVVIIIWSGKEVNNRFGEKLKQEKGRKKMREESDDEPCDPHSLNLVADTKTPTSSNDVALPHYVFAMSFPATLHAPSKSKKETNTESIMDTFRQVKVNIPPLDAIKQVLAYAKFLKDLCIQKCKSRVHINQQVRLTKHMSSILLGHLPPKLKEPNATTISSVIGNYTIDRGLLDLGVSVNLLLYSIYKQFNFGELKPTPVTLSVTNRSVKKPQGVMEDILVKVEKFYYPIDFVVLDMESSDLTKDLIPVLLG
ncbi:uncharacterized protein LOC131148689 [Malania oleifera]|uniref:uncharacterized protein LOC131148689 n=1 Tax=Malania oleifera TaxID=397392 RepID=UPI0025AE5CEA|nr:uncharacterized protein LOC131148689 [Malania oleifera]